MEEKGFTKLIEFLGKIPAITGTIGKGAEKDKSWWVKFSIDIQHQLAWNTIQELGHILNYLSIDERLPTNFYPVSPPPYMNGGPQDFLSWIIECHDPKFRPENCVDWLSGRLPNPVDDLEQWQTE